MAAKQATGSKGLRLCLMNLQRNLDKFTAHFFFFLHNQAPQPSLCCWVLKLSLTMLILYLFSVLWCPTGLCVGARGGLPGQTAGGDG